MQPASFAQIQGTPSKQPIQAVSGVISQVYKREYKAGQYGQYSIQKIQIQEPGTGQTLRASIFDADELTPQHVGQGFTATLGQNSKDQWVGLSADHYQSQTQGMIYGVKCGKGGLIYINGQPWSAGVPAPAPQTQQWAPPQPQPQQFVPPPLQQQFPNPPQGYSPQPTAPLRQAAPPVPAPQGFVPQMGLPQPYIQQIEQKSPLAFLTCQSAAYAMCFEAALRVREQVQIQLEQGPGEPMSTSDLKDIATTFFIEGSRKGIFNNVVGNVTEESGDQP